MTDTGSRSEQREDMEAFYKMRRQQREKDKQGKRDVFIMEGNREVISLPPSMMATD